MQRAIEDHAFVGDGRCGALVARDGTVDWMCAPRFDSPPFLCALLGDDDNGSWRLAPAGPVRCIGRAYRDASMALETVLESEGGVVRLIDVMPRDAEAPRLVRIVEGVRGAVPVRSELRARLDFGTFLPRAERRGAHRADCWGAGDALAIESTVPLDVDDRAIRALFAVRGGERQAIVLTWHPPSAAAPGAIDPAATLRRACDEAERWSAKLRLPAFGGAVARRSAIVLRSLIYAPTGALCAAPTSSLPERVGGPLNWDYRFAWIRDTAFAIWALLAVGANDEAVAALRWLLRTCAGRPEAIQAAYTIDGYRRIEETFVEELPGYRNSRPVRVGNAAASQVQLDVFGEILISAIRVEEAGHALGTQEWRELTTIAQGLHSLWRGVGHGFWEVRGAPTDHITGRTLTCAGMRAMARGARRRGESERERRYVGVADEAEQDIRERFVDRRRPALVTTGRNGEVGATSLWPILMGIVDGDDPVAHGTIRAVQRDLVRGGLMYRAERDLPHTDPAHPREGAFLPCSGWLARAQARCGQLDAAARTFASFAATANDAGVFSEEFDVRRRTMLGNLPQAFTHAEAILAARVLSDAGLRE